MATALPPPCKVPRLDQEVIESKDEQLLKNSQDELYVVQHYHLSPDEFVDSIFNMCMHGFLSLRPFLYTALSEVLLSEEEKNNSSIPVVSKKIADGQRTLVQSLYDSLQKRSDILSLYLENNILYIPENIVLPEDAVQEQYKELIDTLNRERDCSKIESEYTKENAIDLLTKEADDLLLELENYTSEQIQLENDMTLSSDTIKRVESVANSLSNLENDIPEPIQEFLMNAISAASKMFSKNL